MGILDKIIKKGRDEKSEKKSAAVSDSDNSSDNKSKDEAKKTLKTLAKENGNVKKESDNKKIESKKVSKTKIKKIAKEKIPMHHFEALRSPHISEKALNLASENKYVFKIYSKANKSEIKKAVRNLYGVSVKDVNIIRVPNKPKRFKGIPGVKRGYKKAIITLSKGNTLDVMEGVNIN